MCIEDAYTVGNLHIWALPFRFRGSFINPVYVQGNCFVKRNQEQYLYSLSLFENKEMFYCEKYFCLFIQTNEKHYDSKKLI